MYMYLTTVAVAPCKHLTAANTLKALTYIVFSRLFVFHSVIINLCVRYKVNTNPYIPILL